MFKKILIANRGEIAVRIIRACREMGIATVALYETSDQNSLHVRLADECLRLSENTTFFDQENILNMAQASGSEAIHPGYGFLAENAAFAEACTAAGVTFIGPSAEVIRQLTQKIPTLKKAAAAGIPTVSHSERSFLPDELDELKQTANGMGYPLVLKSCMGGRGPGERLIRKPAALERALYQSWSETRAFYGEERLFMEKAILPAHQVGVQIMADQHGNLIHLGEHEGSIIIGGRKVIEESPAPCLTSEQRTALLEMAVNIAKLFDYDNLGTVEFFIDGNRQFFFSEIKSRLQVEHSLTELRSGTDLIKLQIQSAAGQPLSLTQGEVNLTGWSMMARLRAVDPNKNYMPSPGRLAQVRFPTGNGVRVDTHAYSGIEMSPRYATLIAKLTSWGGGRHEAQMRLLTALEEAKISGTNTNVAVLRRILSSSHFREGQYNTDFKLSSFKKEDVPEQYLEDLAVMAAVLYSYRDQTSSHHLPERFTSGWHRSSRRLRS